MRKYIHKSANLGGIPRTSGIKGLLLVGERSSICPRCWFGGREVVKIGNDVTVSKGCSFITGSFNPEAYLFSGHRMHGYKPITIGNHVWIASNVTILGGVTIADNIIIAAGAVVNKDLPDSYAVYAGVPAKKVKQYYKPG